MLTVVSFSFSLFYQKLGNSNQNHATLLYSHSQRETLKTFFNCCPDQFSVQCVATVIASPPAGPVPVLSGPGQTRSGALWLVCPGPPA